MTDITATYIDHCGSDLSVVNAARVSFGKKSEFTKECHNCGEHTVSKYEHINLWECGSCYIDIDQVNMKISDRDTKLIQYLAKHKHISPFGHAFASFHVKAPIFVARQLVKHKFLRWNEISRRYVDDEPEFYVPDVWRGRSADKKQGSSDEAVDVPPFEDYYVDYQGGLHIGESSEHNLYCLEYYKHLLDAGVAPEQARMVLPQSTMTEWYWSGSLDAFADMCRLRLPSDTQQETRVVAQQISEKMSELFPVSWAALIKGETE
jgi:thymidylate synthase (FAD)